MAAKPRTAAKAFTIPTMSTASGTASVSRWRLLALSLLALAIACSTAAALTRDDPAIEGAYINRSIGGAVSGTSVSSVQGGNSASHALTVVAAGLMLAALLAAVSA